MSKNLIITLQNGVRTIKFNQASTKNSITDDMYRTIIKTLNTDASDDSVAVTILTGVGDYYSSGTDLKMKPNAMDDYETTISRSNQLIYDFISAFINYPKLLMAVVNGPAIGIAVTTLALCDLVYASDRATFVTPFVNIGFCPEGCSSYLFPRLMGRSKASEVLLLGRKLNAKEAETSGLVAKVIAHDKLDELFLKLEGYAKIPINTIKRSKALIMANFKGLNEVNRRELTMLKECMQSEEFFEGISSFLNKKKSKL